MPYEGTLSWSNGDKGTVRDAIVRNDRIAFDVRSPGGTFSVVLRPHPIESEWVGGWTSGGRRDKVNARVKKDSDNFELVGHWLDELDYEWELTLSPQQ